MICWVRVRLVRLSWVWTKRSRRMPAASGGTRMTVTTDPSGTAAGRLTTRPRPKGPLVPASSRVLIRVIGAVPHQPFMRAMVALRDPGSALDRRVLLMLRQRVRDHVPRRPRAHEDVVRRADPGVVVERAHGHDRDVRLGDAPRHARAAHPAERVPEVARRGQVIDRD